MPRNTGVWPVTGAPPERSLKVRRRRRPVGGPGGPRCDIRPCFRWGVSPVPCRMASNGAAAVRRPVVFLADVVDVQRPLGDVRRHLCGGADWLVPLAHAATDDGDTALVRLGPGSLGTRAGVVTRIRLGACTRRGNGVFVPMRWEAASHSGLFPVLDGDLDLSPLDGAGCRISLNASYRPPLEGLGRVLDTIVLHRVAESTVRSFLQRLAGSLEDRCSGEGTAGAA